jgi:hypothetical protein
VFVILRLTIFFLFALAAFLRFFLAPQTFSGIRFSTCLPRYISLSLFLESDSLF